MYLINKIVWGLVNPVVAGSLLMLAAAVLAFGPWRRFSGWAAVVAIVWWWFWSSGICSLCIGVTLEREFLVDGRVPRVQDLPAADAIVILGGSMGGDGEFMPYPEMWTSADRVWQGARLFKAGKAPRIILTSGGVDRSTLPLLADFGVPTNAVMIIGTPRNTEEEARAVRERFGNAGSECVPIGAERPRILLVTSASHMKRARMMFGLYAGDLTVIPAPADWEFSLLCSGRGRSGLHRLCSMAMPDAEALSKNVTALHEWMGILWYHIR